MSRIQTQLERANDKLEPGESFVGGTIGSNIRPLFVLVFGILGAVFVIVGAIERSIAAAAIGGIVAAVCVVVWIRTKNRRPSPSTGSISEGPLASALLGWRFWLGITDHDRLVVMSVSGQQAAPTAVIGSIPINRIDGIGTTRFRKATWFTIKFNDGSSARFIVSRVAQPRAFGDLLNQRIKAQR